MLLTILIILIFVVLLGFYNAYLLLDDKTNENDPKNKRIEKIWHTFGSAIFIYISLLSWWFSGWQYAFFTLNCFWTIFGGIVHKIGLKKEFFYVGTTANTDKFLRWLFKKNTIRNSAILRILLLIISVILILLFL